MSDNRSIALVFDNSDKQFFAQYPLRKAHIRLPYLNECSGEFWSLGDHNRTRRRILLCRTDARGAFLPDNKIMKIPFLAFADETIEDTDEVLLPIIDEIMTSAANGAAR